MEGNFLLFINKVYIDLLKKDNCNKGILRSIKLISKMIKTGYIKDSYVLIRSVYEELMGELAIISNSNFQIDVKTEPGKIRSKVIDNINVLFKEDTIDEKYIKDIYSYLSNISHESTTRRLLKDLACNNKSKSVIIDNTYFVLETVAYIYLNYLYINKEESDFIDKLYVAGISTLMMSLYKFSISLSPEEAKKYNEYFITQRDINFMNKKRNEILEIKDDIITNPIDEDLVKEYFSDFEKLLEKYNYINLYKKCMNESQ